MSAPTLTTAQIAALVAAATPGACSIKSPVAPYQWFPVRSVEYVDGGGIVFTADNPPVVTAPPPPVVTSVPTTPVAPTSNEPAGYTVISGPRPMAAIVESGWKSDAKSASGGMSLAQDPTCPVGPNVMVVTYPEGLVIGDTPCQQDLTLPAGITEVYARWYAWYSEGFDTDPAGILKQFYLWSSNQIPTLIIGLVGAPGPQSPWQPQVRTQEVSELDLPPNVAGQTGFTVSPGTWHKTEVQIIQNSGAGANGVARIWVDGVKVAEYTSENFASGAAPTWVNFQLAPYWGGNSNPPVTLPQTQTMRLAGTYISGK